MNEAKENADQEADGSKPAAEIEETGTKISAALTEDLSALRTVALSLAIAERPNIALCAVIHPLALSLFYPASASSSAARISLAFKGPHQDAVDPDNNQAIEEMATLHNQFREKLPENHCHLWTWLTEQTPPNLMKLLAYLTARSIDGWHQKYDQAPSRFEHVEQLVQAVDLDMGKWWKPSKAFLKRVPKAVAIEAVREAGGKPEVCNAMAKDSKADAIDTALNALDRTGWMPTVLRNKEPTVISLDDPAETEMQAAD